MSDRVRDRDRFGTPVGVDPERHEAVGVDQAVEDPRGDPGPESPREAEEIAKGPVVKFLESFLGMAEAKPRPGVVMLSGDEQAHRIVSDDALTAIGEAIDRLVTVEPRRVESVPSGVISAESTTVGTVASQIVGRNEARLRVRVRVRTAGAVVTIGQSRSVTDGAGYTLEDNDELILETSAPLFAVSDTAGTTIKILSEFAAS